MHGSEVTPPIGPVNGGIEKTEGLRGGAITEAGSQRSGSLSFFDGTKNVGLETVAIGQVKPNSHTNGLLMRGESAKGKFSLGEARAVLKPVHQRRMEFKSPGQHDRDLKRREGNTLTDSVTGKPISLLKHTEGKSVTWEQPATHTHFHLEQSQSRIGLQAIDSTLLKNMNATPPKKFKETNSEPKFYMPEANKFNMRSSVASLTNSSKLFPTSGDIVLEHAIWAAKKQPGTHSIALGGTKSTRNTQLASKLGILEVSQSHRAKLTPTATPSVTSVLNSRKVSFETQNSSGSPKKLSGEEILVESPSKDLMGTLPRVKYHRSSKSEHAKGAEQQPALSKPSNGVQGSSRVSVQSQNEFLWLPSVRETDWKKPKTDQGGIRSHRTEAIDSSSVGQRTSKPTAYNLLDDQVTGGPGSWVSSRTEAKEYLALGSKWQLLEQNSEFQSIEALEQANKRGERILDCLISQKKALLAQSRRNSLLSQSGSVFGPSIHLPSSYSPETLALLSSKFDRDIRDSENQVAQLTSELRALEARLDPKITIEAHSILLENQIQSTQSRILSARESLAASQNRLAVLSEQCKQKCSQ